MEIKSHAAAPKDDAFDLEPKPLLPSLGSAQRDPPARSDHPVPRKSDPSGEGIHCEPGCVGVPGSRRDLTVGGDLSPGNSSDDRADPRECGRDHDAARIGACALNDFPAGGRCMAEEFDSFPSAFPSGRDGGPGRAPYVPGAEVRVVETLSPGSFDGVAEVRLGRRVGEPLAVRVGEKSES